MSTIAARTRNRFACRGISRRLIGVVAAAMTLFGALAAPAQAETVAFYMPGTSPTPPVSQTVGVSALGAAVQGLMTTAYQIGYPASIGPFTGAGALALDYSVAQGVANLGAAIAAVPATDNVKLFGVSQGDIVLTYEEYALIAAGHPNNVTFIRIADPSGPTGILGRNAGLLLPGISCVIAPQDSPYNTIDMVHQYDVFADWPANQLNLLADLNAVAGGILFHNYWAYNVDLSTIPAGDVTTTVNSLGATTTTYFIRDNGLLPILQLAKNAGASDQIVNALQPILEPIVDSAYRPLPPMVQIPQRVFQTVVNAAVVGGIWTLNALRDTNITAGAALNNLSRMFSAAETQLQKLTSAAAQATPTTAIGGPTTTIAAATPSSPSEATRTTALTPRRTPTMTGSPQPARATTGRARPLTMTTVTVRGAHPASGNSLPAPTTAVPSGRGVPAHSGSTAKPSVRSGTVAAAPRGEDGPGVSGFSSERGGN